jgi:hypothetical protein
MSAEEKPFTPSLEYALNSLRAAIEQAGTAGISIDAWRQHFYAGHAADTLDGKRQAFRRAREKLARLGKITVHNDIYSVTERDSIVTCHNVSQPIPDTNSVTDVTPPL